VTLRFYRGKVFPLSEKAKPPLFKPKTWNGEPRLKLPALGGELRFKRVRGQGIDARIKPLEVRLRSGGERLQLDAKRPRRTLKNLFQEAGVPPWERERLPLLYRGADLVWAPGLGVDVKFLAPSRAEGLLPEWTAYA
jgi:tRNA(Ile)-lysidine synthase